MKDKSIEQYIYELIETGVLESIGDGISIQDTDFKILYQNSKHKSFIGDHTGEYCYKAYEKRADKCDGCPLAMTYEDGLPHTAERTALVDGEISHFEITASPLKDKKEKIIAGIEVVRHITERKRNEEALRENEEKYRLLFTADQDAIIMVDAETLRIIDANDAALSLYGYSKEEILKLTGPDLSAEPEKSAAAISDIATPSDKYIYYHTRIHRKKDKTVFPVDISSGTFILKNRKIVSAMIRDITERKRFEKEIAESRLFTDNLIETSNVMIIALGTDGNIHTFNPAAERITGYKKEDISGNNWFEILVPRERYPYVWEEFNRLMEGGLSKLFENPILTKNGEERIISWSNNEIKHDGEIVGSLSFGIDITDHKKLEEQFLQSQKLEAVGKLAGGVAHDINNMLTAIISYAYIMKVNQKENGGLQHSIDQILNVSQKGAHLTRSLLAFSRKQIIDLKPLRLNNIIEDLKNLLEKLIGEDIEIRTDLSNKELTVRADRGQIEQVLMNLAVNAREAMPDGGTLTIQTESVEIDPEFVKYHEHEKPRPYVLISVTDTGTGMDDETRQQIFEPFFTTKEVGVGTGLGLATVYGIIKQHKGYIHVSSSVGKGTTFSIQLPLIAEEAENNNTVDDTFTFKGTGTVLLAEDQEEVRESLKAVIESFGLTVIEAVDGQDAIEKYMENRNNITLLLIDVVMPKKNGIDAFEEIRKVNPDVKALFMSGYTPDIIEKKGILKKGLNFIRKPISPDYLSTKFKELLHD